MAPKAHLSRQYFPGCLDYWPGFPVPFARPHAPPPWSGTTVSLGTMTWHAARSATRRLSGAGASDRLTGATASPWTWTKPAKDEVAVPGSSDTNWPPHTSHRGPVCQWIHGRSRRSQRSGQRSGQKLPQSRALPSCITRRGPFHSPQLASHHMDALAQVLMVSSSAHLLPSPSPAEKRCFTLPELAHLFQLFCSLALPLSLRGGNKQAALKSSPLSPPEERQRDPTFACLHHRPPKTPSSLLCLRFHCQSS